MGKGHSITIGDLKFDSKSQAIEFYKKILNSYEADTELNDEDFESVLALCKKNMETEKEPLTIDNIIVDFHPTYHNTKCFQIVIDGYCYMFSYRLSISGSMSDMQLFSKACRNAVNDHLREYKKDKFKNRPVRCAITNEIVEWEECQIDHKFPLTFSVIVKSFIVANKINVKNIEYTFEHYLDEFSDKALANKFCDFHNGMAVLRILSIKCNNKLAANARITPTKKDKALSDIPLRVPNNFSDKNETNIKNTTNINRQLSLFD